MDIVEIRTRIKNIIAQVTQIPAEEIGDDASLVEDLDLDSLSLLEIGVDVDFEFKLGLPQDELPRMQTVQDAVDLVLEHLGRPPQNPS